MTNIRDEETRGAAVPELTQATLATQEILKALQERNYWQARARLAEQVCQKATERYRIMANFKNGKTLQDVKQADNAEWRALHDWKRAREEQ